MSDDVAVSVSVCTITEQESKDLFRQYDEAYQRYLEEAKRWKEARDGWKEARRRREEYQNSWHENGGGLVEQNGEHFVFTEERWQQYLDELDRLRQEEERLWRELVQVEDVFCDAAGQWEELREKLKSEFGENWEDLRELVESGKLNFTVPVPKPKPTPPVPAYLWAKNFPLRNKDFWKIVAVSVTALIVFGIGWLWLVKPKVPPAPPNPAVTEQVEPASDDSIEPAPADKGTTPDQQVPPGGGQPGLPAPAPVPVPVPVPGGGVTGETFQPGDLGGGVTGETFQPGDLGGGVTGETFQPGDLGGGVTGETFQPGDLGGGVTGETFQPGDLGGGVTGETFQPGDLGGGSKF
ncbi:MULTISPECIES: hypothetical protein [unclassified Rhodococcus (in: high G+C Gram-positive bacteria)]|uniref:hypothetical protein n=1 Tax=unclassified Rhodococcus (in: high G+C Gram-positive bacteria) TaxID=192944 RepID=UPI00163AC285|nr:MULTISPECIES: hypothetical protein [unclassified Rhodococcus (in: high G+C Gram-positive bacteria)]MBC2644408.1 hypothetical protein [Rhodococcus sp. 3A]MBC2897900.1 hypothetical protein [Rhodococcus sp. 4CII]